MDQQRWNEPSCIKEVKKYTKYSSHFFKDIEHHLMNYNDPYEV